ncbi:MAG: hybrid sensor histidine kinase/response regulator [Nitrospinaceae bacterium]|nr:hybrid sensor histidine kinase/response regulator [Nitrospinaceae bacterium]
MNAPTDPPKPIKILVVDDTPANIDILFQTLEPEGCTLSVATSGEDALNLVSEIQPDLILLDIMMPGIDGYETCRRLKEDESTCNIPVIFLTAKNQTKDIVIGLSAGGVDYITKPFRQEEVCARIRKHIQLQTLKNKLEEQNQTLSELNETKNRLLGMASHDLRNPLTSIQGYSKFLLSKGDQLEEGARKEFLEIIYSASGNMLALVNDLLNLSVIESGELILSLKLSSIGELIEERVRLYDYMAQGKNIKLLTSLEDIPEFSFDPQRIGQVLDNLLSNAIKFTPPGSRIHIHLKEINERIQVSVRDEGLGIKEEEQDKLFLPFGKLSSKPTGGEGGTGLGLAIAKKMIDAHHGEMKVRSETGKGTEFSFEIPLV